MLIEDASPDGIKLSDQIEGGVLGLLIGDAMGVPYEFHPASEIPAAPDMVPPVGFARAHVGIPPGTWSDDGAQALALLDSLLEKGEVDVHDLGDRLLQWLTAGRYAPDANVFDVGIQTRRALEIVRAGALGLIEHRDDQNEHTQGNGSLMRSLPFALWSKQPDLIFIEQASRQSAVTHWHTNVHVCVAVYVMWARVLIETNSMSPGGSWFQAIARVGSLLRTPASIYALKQIERWEEPLTGSGYVFDSLLSARHVVLNSDSYAETVRKAIKFGNDTDTTACIAGGIAGLIYGVDGIPLAWRDKLRAPEIYRPLLENLLAWRLAG